MSDYPHGAAPHGAPPLDDPDGGEEHGAFERVRELLHLVLRRRLVVLVIVAGGIALGWYWLQHQIPIHRATATVMIDVRAPKILSNVNEVVELGTSNHYGANILFFESQYEIIKSRAVAERVLDRLGLWDSEHLLGLDMPGVEMSAEERATALAEANLADVLAARLQVTPVKKSMMVEISFEDSDPLFAQTIVNAAAEAYKVGNLDNKRQVVAEATRQLEVMAADWERQHTEASERTRTFEVEHSVGTIPNAKKAIDERLAMLGKRMTEANIEQTELEAKSKALAQYKSVKNIDKLSSGRLLEDEVIRALAEKVAGLEADLAGLEVKYLPQHPEVASRQSQLTSLRTSIRTRVRNLARSVDADLASVKAVATGLGEELDRAKQDERKITDIEREYGRLVETEEQYNKQAEEIRRRYIETTMSAQAETNNVRVLDTAISAVQVRPRRALAMGVAMLLSILAGLAAAFVLEYADSTIRTREDLIERTGLRVLGVLPVMREEDMPQRDEVDDSPKSRDFYIHERPRSRTAEAFRALRTNLLFMRTARRFKTLMFTSAEPSEGKSTISINTAIAMALSGSKVLLVEGDMRRPRFAMSFDVDEDMGLTTALAGDGPVAEYVQATDIAGLDILPCGPIPPNPAELLHTERFLQLKSQMEEDYDLVIFDSPPVNPVADALVLGSLVDACLVVVRAERTSRHALRAALRSLQAVSVGITGAVLNHRESARGKSYGYGRYGYGTDYGYGEYGYRYPDDKQPASAEA